MLVLQQLKGEYETKDEGMIQYMQVVQSLISDFLYKDINKMPKSENTEADQLSKYELIEIPNSD